jgi:hypothetical protein
MQATDITFGVEFEVSMPSSNATFTVGGYHRGAQILELPDGWNAQSDASIQSAPGFVGVEIVSPVLKGVDGIKQVIQACRWLESRGAVVNVSTGFHVHVGFDRTNEKALKRLVATVANHEQAIYATTGSRDRATNGYCRSVLRSEEAKFVHKNGLPASISRYSLLNLSNLASGNKPTVEFRAFAGTVDAVTAIGYIRLCVGFVERAIADTCPRCFGRKLPGSVTDGVSAVKRMFKYLGWDKSEPVFGRIESSDIPAVKVTKKQLLKLAAQYDSAAAAA